jgi:hypothetical protein
MVDDGFDLAVYKIKLELRDGNSTKNKLLILQALRWVSIENVSINFKVVRNHVNYSYTFNQSSEADDLHVFSV